MYAGVTSRPFFLALDEIVKVDAIKEQFSAEIDAGQLALPLQLADRPRREPEIGGGLRQGK